MRPRAKCPSRVMLVDDHPIIREGVRSYLRNQAEVVVVGEASDDKEAMRKARELEPDVVILDITLPSLDGGELAKRLRRALPKAKLIAFSIHASEEYVVRMARCGAHGYVMKDQPTAVLLEAIRSVVRGGLFFPSDMTGAILSQGPGRVRRREPSLTRREREVLTLIADGLPYKQIARKLGIALRTAEAHRDRLADKLGIRTVAGLTKYAIQHGLATLR